MTKQRKRLEALYLKLSNQKEELQKKIDEVNAKITEEKNTEITEMVDVFDLTPEELQEVLKQYKEGKAKKNPEDYAGQTTHHKETEGNSRESEDIANAD